MHVHVTMFVSVCTISTRQVYCMPHTCITIWYVQAYCVLECMRICHYDDVQVHVCNNASVCTSVSQYKRMHVHALCVSCKEITTRNHCNRSRVGEAGIRNFSKHYGKLERFIHATRELCECVANSLTRAMLNNDCHGRSKITAIIGICFFGTIVLRCEKSSSFFLLIYLHKLTAWVRQE